ncbi:Peptidyl-tRNA hydrolase [uncultured archaeon]|nr:Peptidyl-tRNA hydrolase [uncultured archaeon]
MNCKQMIFIRNDLKMGKGKIAAQAAHASIASFLENDDEKNSEWINQGMKKIVLKINENDVKNIVSECKKNKINFAVIHDAGKTQVEAGTLTAIGVGPEEEKKLEKPFQKYKLL